VVKSNDLENSAQVNAATGAANRPETTPISPDLVVIIETWDCLTVEAKRQILNIVQAAGAAAQAGTPPLDGSTGLSGFRGDEGGRGV
jgi:hypothetical protein